MNQDQTLDDTYSQSSVGLMIVLRQYSGYGSYGMGMSIVGNVGFEGGPTTERDSKQHLDLY